MVWASPNGTLLFAAVGQDDTTIDTVVSAWNHAAKAAS